MKILKANTKEIFDTENPSVVEFHQGNSTGLSPLHHIHSMSDHQFLNQYFKLDHSIFIDFTESYFYELKKTI